MEDNKSIGREIFELDNKMKRLSLLMQEAELIATEIKNIGFDEESEIDELKESLKVIQKEMGELSKEVFLNNKAENICDRFAILKELKRRKNLF